MDAKEFEAKYGLKIKGDLDLRGMEVSSLPEGLEIGGSLLLQGCTLETLPPNLTINGSLKLENTNIKALSPYTTINGKLNLSYSTIMELPEYLTCTKLQLKKSPLKILPAHLTINYWLKLTKTNIEEIGEYLYVQNWLDLTGSKVKKIGNHLTVRDDLYLSRCPLKSLPEYLHVGDEWYRASEMDKYGGSNIHLDNTQITHIPDHCHIEFADLSKSNIKSFGKDVCIAILTLGETIPEGDINELYTKRLIICKSETDINHAVIINNSFITIRDCEATFPESLDVSFLSLENVNKKNCL